VSELTAAPLGVFDSGVGGLTVLRALRDALPSENFLYVGDTARVPYGSKPLEMVKAFAQEIGSELVRRGVKGIVIACNTASAVSLPELADLLPVPVWGVIDPGVKAALGRTRSGYVGILGTKATVRARAYQDRLEAAGLRTWAQACPLFVPVVEEGISDTAIAHLIAEHYLADRPGVDTVILGCTHYPALKGTLQRVLGDDIALVDSADETAAVVARELRAAGLQNTTGQLGGVHHLVSGDIPSYLHTARILGGPEGQVERFLVPLDISRSFLPVLRPDPPR